MKFNIGLILLVSMVLGGCVTLHNQGIKDKAFLGAWTALSNNHVSICGDMIITPGKIDFAKKGRVDFDVIKYDGKEYILKINRNVDAGLFMRLGPIVPSRYSKDFEMEVAYYSSEAKALAKRKGRIDNASSWGIYIRTNNTAKQKVPPPKK